MNPEDLAKALAQPGRASIPYLDRYSPDRPLVLECFRPQGHDPDKPVVIVQHGMSRNGAEYYEAWVPAAERHGLLIVAITFSKDAWPDAVTYNNGHVLAEDGSFRPRECWSQAIPGRVFALLREAGVTRRDKTYLWGHSAGGQFVHRLLATQPHGISRRSEPPIPAGIRYRRSTFPTRRSRRHRADARGCRSSSWLPAGDLFRRPGHRWYGRELSEARNRDGAGAKPIYTGAVLHCPRAGGSRKARRALPLEPHRRAGRRA
jgi:hypothetical protein